MPISLPRWQQLPDIALYMDQVLLVLGSALEPVAADDTPMVTAAMINNYVKMKLTPPPEKKKYGRAQLAWFLMICLMKKVLSMQEIAALQERLLAESSLETIYDLFCRELELRMQQPAGAASQDCPPILATTARAVACKLQLEGLLSGKLAISS